MTEECKKSVSKHIITFCIEKTKEILIAPPVQLTIEWSSREDLVSKHNITFCIENDNKVSEDCKDPILKHNITYYINKGH